MQRSQDGQPAWRVLLIGGSSAVGKTRVAQALARHFGLSVLLADDLRMAIQEVTTPAQQPGLHYFLAHPTIWQKPAEALCEGFITVATAMTRPLSMSIAHHVFVESAGQVIIEGDGILPALAAQSNFANTQFTPARVTNEVRSLFLFEPEPEVVFRNMRQRGRGFDALPSREQETLAHASWLYGMWLSQQAVRYHLPLIEVRPWDTLMDRVMRMALT